MDIRLLQTFCCVVKLGSFKRAADHLNTTQPSISARIAQLEDIVGGQILDRDRGRPSVATSRGLELFGYAEQLLRMHDDMLVNLRSEALNKGVIRLGVSETATYLWLPAVLTKIAEIFPNLSLDVTVDVSHQLSKSLLGGDIDLALLLGPVEDLDVVNLDIGEIALDFLVGQRHSLAGTQPGVDEIVQHPIITFSRMTSPHRAVVSAFAAHGLYPRKIFGCNSIASAVQLVLGGIGIGVLPGIAIAGMRLQVPPALLEVDVRLAPMRFTASYLNLPGNAAAAAVARLVQTVAAAPTATA